MPRSQTTKSSSSSLELTTDLASYSSLSCMPTMRHSNSVANLHDKQQLPHHHSTSKMKVSKSAPDLLKKAVTSIKSKTDALRTKLIILASMRRRMAMVAAMSRKVHTLVSSSSQEKITVVDHRDRALVLTKAMAPPSKEEPACGSDHGGKKAAGLSLFEIAVFDEDDCHGYRHDWTSSLFDDDDNYHCKDEEDVHEGGGDLDVLGALDEPSVIEVIRSNREAQGLKFNIDDEIDEACDMFIRRCRSRMDLTL